MQYAKEIYDLSVKYWYEVADNRMKGCGHPGVSGPSSNDKNWNPTVGMLDGAIITLTEIRNKLQNGV